MKTHLPQLSVVLASKGHQTCPDKQRRNVPACLFSVFFAPGVPSLAPPGAFPGSFCFRCPIVDTTGRVFPGCTRVWQVVGAGLGESGAGPIENRGRCVYSMGQVGRGLGAGAFFRWELAPLIGLTGFPVGQVSPQ